MLGVCTPNMQFVYVLPGWEGSVADGRVLRDAISRRHGLKVPHGCYYLVDAGYINCEGFLALFRGQRYHLNEWLRVTSQARPNLKSRIRTLKREWSIIYDMLSGKNNSGFGWDEHRQLVVAKDASRKEAAQFRHRSFPYYDQLTAIYAKDRATGKDVQTAADIIEEINAEDVTATNTHEERNDFHGSEADVSLDDMDLSATQPQPEPQPARNHGDSVFSKKKKKISDSIASEVVIQQKSEMTIQESALKLYPTLCEVEGLIEDERYRALSKIPDHPMQMLIFFSLPYAVRLEWVRRFLADH
ncbi:hypothetical protein GOBAR_AA23836 [Gossypium barbadense]|uniref:DDE Tnp4 domain-containing protein n=1 Tax=Gossypium barbadense TaxID=3634 RepID=A0A2P5X0F9_GOSBA|nr:hypothetical protein GOBAR_AA23836 [Gossypium barbadense]